MNKITYDWISPKIILVYLDGKHVGYIKDVGKTKHGWQYYSKGKKEGGEIFGSLQKCKQSLEGEWTITEITLIFYTG